MRIAIIIHAYYPELWPELLKVIRASSFANPDVFVTVPTGHDKLMREIMRDVPFASFTQVENRGYDILPFLTVLDGISLEKYDYVLKLHTKRDCSEWVNYLYLRGGVWRRLLLQRFVTEKSIKSAINFFENHPKVGMIGHAALTIGGGDYLESEGIRIEAEKVVCSIGLNPAKRLFIAGTMFLVRAKCLAPMQHSANSRHFGLSAGGPMDAAIHVSDLAHVYERAFGYAILAQGYSIADYSVSSFVYPLTYPFRKVSFLVLRFLYRTILKPMCS